MKMRRIRIALFSMGLGIAAACSLGGCGPSPHDAQASRTSTAQTPLAPVVAAGNIDAKRLAGADLEPDQWFTGGRDFGQSYYSPLGDIDTRNVARLGFAWDFDLGTRRGLEATPVVVDGTMYAVGNWGRVYALDARTGRNLWSYDPQPDGQSGRYACCDVVNRGLAVWKG